MILNMLMFIIKFMVMKCHDMNHYENILIFRNDHIIIIT